MTARPPKPSDRYAVSVFANPGEKPRFIVDRKTYEWWGRKGTYFEKTAETMVGGVIYDDADAAVAERDKLNEGLK